MLLQALHVETEMKNLNLQVTLLVPKGVGTRSHTLHPWLWSVIMAYIFVKLRKHLAVVYWWNFYV